MNKRDLFEQTGKKNAKVDVKLDASCFCDNGIFNY